MYLYIIPATRKRIHGVEYSFVFQIIPPRFSQIIEKNIEYSRIKKKPVFVL